MFDFWPVYSGERFRASCPLVSFIVVPFFTNTVQTMLKKAINMGRKGMALNCHGPLWAEMAMGRIDQRLLFAAKNFDSQ